jgi:hypothetical protein
MKFGKRLGVIASIATVAWIVPAFSAQAQGSGCTLAAADCQLLTSATTNIAKETSFVQTFTFKVDIKGDSPVSIQASGTGPFSVDSTQKDQAALIKSIQAQLDIKGSSAASGTTPAQSGNVSTIIKDGVLYVQDPKTQKWMGTELSKLISAAQGSASGSGSAASSSAAAQKALAQITSDPAVVTSLAAIPNIKGFITQKRLSEDATLENQKMAQIQYTITPSVLFSAPEILPLIKAALKAASAASPSAGGSASQFGAMDDSQLQGMLAMGGGILGTSNIQVTSWIGTEDKTFHGLDLLVNLSIDSSMMGGTGAPLTGTINLHVELTKIGQPVTVTAPAGATMVDSAQLMAGGGAGAAATAAATP